jgi:hypothetical protein
MKVWLKDTGSPKSKVERVQFGQELELKKQTFEEFKIVRDYDSTATVTA